MDIVDFWSRMERGQNIHPADKEVFARISEEKHGFVTKGCLPACFIGDLRNAPLALLYLSPGFGEQDLIDAKTNVGKDHYLKCWQGKQLIPEMGWAGEKWFKSRTKCFGSFEVLRRHTAILNIGAYHSKKVQDFASLMALPSSRVSLTWAQNILFPAAEKRERTVICMRSAAYWGLEPGRKYRGTLYAPYVTRGGHFIKNKQNQKLILHVRSIMQDKERLT